MEHSFNKYLLSPSCVFPIVLERGDGGGGRPAFSRSVPLPSRAHPSFAPRSFPERAGSSQGFPGGAQRLWTFLAFRGTCLFCLCLSLQSWEAFTGRDYVFFVFPRHEIGKSWTICWILSLRRKLREGWVCAGQRHSPSRAVWFVMGAKCEFIGWMAGQKQG